jgi:hypothetical protein
VTNDGNEREGVIQGRQYQRRVVGTANQPLRRSKSTAYKSLFVYCTKQLTSVFFSASSFYPNRGATGSTLPASNLYLSDNEFNNPDESDVESESDWLDEPRQDKASEVTPRQASKFSEALVIEVCS